MEITMDASPRDFGSTPTETMFVGDGAGGGNCGGAGGNAVSARGEVGVDGVAVRVSASNGRAVLPENRHVLGLSVIQNSKNT